MTYSKRFTLVSLLLFGLVSFFSLSVVQAIEYGGLGIYPNESEVDEKNILTKSWFIYTLELGELKEAKVDVVNTSDNPVEVKVYPVDAVTTKDGAFAPEPESREKVDVGTWVTLAESELSLGPREIKTIDFTVKVPENAEVGDHAGAIIIQSKKPPEEVEGTGLRITTRVGARMYIFVPGDIVKELEFNEFTWKIIDGKPTFFLTFVNKGNVRIRPKGEIEIRNIFGKVVDTIKIPEREVFPRDKIVLPVEWQEIPFWVKYGGFVAEAKVTYGPGLEITKELRDITPLLYGAAIFGGIILMITFLLIIKRLRAKKERKEKLKIKEPKPESPKIVDLTTPSQPEAELKTPPGLKVRIMKPQKFQKLPKLFFLLILVSALLFVQVGTIFYLWQQNQGLAELKSIIKESGTAIKEAEIKEEPPVEQIVPQKEDVVPPEKIEVEINKSEISIKVLNGSGVRGAAGQVKNALEKEGFQVQSFGNAKSFNYPATIIRYKVGKLAEAELVRDFIKNKDLITLEEVKDQTIDIILIVGKDISAL